LSELEPVIGLEIHVQLKTRTKMFCSCSLSFGDEPNTHTCPVCLGHPGTLPVVNEQAVRYGLMIGLALGCTPAERSLFHRKNYFYPDLPKGYQISQFDIPLCRDGHLGDVRIHRAHLEEDAAKLIHAGASGRIHGAEASLVDFNRGGTPLVEIVTEPDLESAEQAAEWARLLRATLKRLGVSDVNMEEGSLRVDANVSVRPAGQAVLGTKTELKNMNSFTFLRRGIDAEIARQTELIAQGGRVEQETLHYDPHSGSLTTLRSKEESHDYRYFPEPDLVAVAPGSELLEEIEAEIPELPAERAERLKSEHELPEETARLFAFRTELGDLYEEALDGGDPRTLANWVKNDLVPRLGDSPPEDWKVTPQALSSLLKLVDDGTISAGAGKQVLDELVAGGGDPSAIVEEKGLALAGADELSEIVDRAMEQEADAVEKVRAGNPKAIGAIVGAVMRETKGRADGGEVQRLVREKLGS
jgi:aspartyl-tRNA(Asn)/glutamyl-tRNA(Gln) amidotransferase subunit B